MKNEYFVVANSFAAPFVSDTWKGYVKGETPASALTVFALSYEHPAGLYAAALYVSADAYHKDEAPLAKWLCNHELEKQRLTKGKGCYSYEGTEPGRFRINGEYHQVQDPKGGRLVPV